MDLPTHCSALFCPQELLHYLIGTLLLLIASIVAASKSYSQSGLVAGAVRTLSGAFRNEFISMLVLPHGGSEGIVLEGLSFAESVPTLIRPAAVPKGP